jgi:hypothetical protein
MRKIPILIPLLGFYSFAFCQTVTFKTDSVFLNNKACLLYARTENDFVIYKLDSTKLITGSIQSTGPHMFSTIYTFLTVNKDFTNSKINGRNTLIFALVQNNILSQEGELNEKKLLKFIEKNYGQ